MNSPQNRNNLFLQDNNSINMESCNFMTEQKICMIALIKKVMRLYFQETLI